jgi:phospholipid-binding lipoprotein MlaA
VLAGAALAALGACSTPDLATRDAAADPYEAQNRDVHAFNSALDRTIVRPVAVTYTQVMPDGIEDNIGNLASNLGVPSAAINQALQGRVIDAGRNVLRFAINSTFGIAGLADVASDLGLPPQDADFGQTLAVWGVPQGDYIVRPFLGPSTERATVGSVVDIVLNPLSGRLYPDPAIPAPYDLYATGARVAAGLGQRGRFADTIDSVLYDSVDPYAAARDAYLQNRAFELEQAGVAGAANAPDPYADIFGEE